MSEWFLYLLRSTLVLSLLYGYYYLVLRKQTYYQANRLFLVVSLLFAALVPLITFTVAREITLPFLGGAGMVETEGVEVAARQPQSGVSLVWWLQFVYLAGVGVLSFRFLLSLLRIAWLCYHHPHRTVRRLRVIMLPEGKPVSSFFTLLFLPEIGEREERRRILEHEKIHIRQGHSFDLLLVEGFCLLHWFNPVIWMWKESVLRNHEYIADNRVISRFGIAGYPQLLLKQLFYGNVPFLHAFASSNIQKRISMMTKKTTAKGKSLYLPLLFIGAVLLLAFSQKQGVASVQDREFFTGQQAVKVKAADTLQQKEDVFAIVEKMPSFPEGDVMVWVRKNTKYPAEAVKDSIQGKVYVKFIVEKDGTVTHVQVTRSVHSLLDKEALRVVSSMPKWKPGEQKGDPVRVAYTIPVTFALN